MNQLKKSLAVFIFLIQGCAVNDAHFENVLKSPDEFHNQEIEITGIYCERFEDVAIYLSNGSGKDKALWLNFSESFLSLNTFTGFDGKRIKAKGIFNSTDKGHLGQYAGSLDDAWILFE